MILCSWFKYKGVFFNNFQHYFMFREIQSRYYGSRLCIFNWCPLLTLVVEEIELIVLLHLLNITLGASA